LSYFSNPVCPFRGDLVILLDSSGSIGQYNFHLLTEFLFNLTSYLDIADDRYRTSLITFSDSDSVEFDLTNRSRDDVLARVATAPYRYGSTNIYSALNRMRTQILDHRNGNRPEIPDICLLITDGRSNVFPERTIPEARRLKKDGIALLGVGINLPDVTELRRVVSKPTDKFAMTLNGFKDLDLIRETLVDGLCHGLSPQFMYSNQIGNHKLL